MSDVILRQGDIDRFNTTLSRLVEKTKAIMCVLIHKDGHLLASIGTTALIDSTSLAALISANFSSTIAVANLLGEKEFSAQLHRGKNSSIYISLIDDNTFLTTIFENKIPVDTIRIYCEEYGKELVPNLAILYNNLPEPLTDPQEKMVLIPLEEQIQISHADLAMALQKLNPPEEAEKPNPLAVQPRTLRHTVSGGARSDATPPLTPNAPEKIRSTTANSRVPSSDSKNREVQINAEYLHKKSHEVRSTEQKKAENVLFSRVFTKKQR